MKCIRCKEQITKGRLKVMPDTKLCVQCSELVGGDFVVDIIEENLGGSIVSKPMVFKRPRHIEPLEE